MVKIQSEAIKSNFKGTIIDIETIGQFNKNYKDSRYFKDIIPIILGFINKDGLKVYCAKKQTSIPKLKANIKIILSNLDRPFYAFNSIFERGVFFHQLKDSITFEHELNTEKYEAKRYAVAKLNIPQYDDPFNDRGLLCSKAWLNGNLGKAIAHNRSCLLKERDILLKRGIRKPDELKLVS